MTVSARTRLYVDAPLGQGQSVALSRDHAHYLANVLRLSPGAGVELFNGRDGGWLARLEALGKRGAEARVEKAARPQMDPPDLWLLFAPIKKARTDFIVEKAAEMGVARIQPVQTDFTNSERIRQDRLQAHAIEAAEQCGGTFVPPVEPLCKLAQVLDDWPPDRRLMFCDEALAGQGRGLPDAAGAGPGPAAGPNAGAGPWAILIGPEGGFSERERGRLAGMPQAHAVSLGPRILRADTAAVAALTLWQITLGDWRAQR